MGMKIPSKKCMQGEFENFITLGYEAQDHGFYNIESIKNIILSYIVVSRLMMFFMERVLTQQLS